MSSDALLMNIFCYPGITKRRELSLMLGTEIGDLPEFGFKPCIPLTSGYVERTEIFFQVAISFGDRSLLGLKI
jgi:hypothetical protein